MASFSQRGEIVFDRVCARYRRELPQVLMDVSFTVAPREKVGVVGRTGSGKSTLMQVRWGCQLIGQLGLSVDMPTPMQTLFRILELDTGSIRIDGVDIARLGLKQLRGAISILPQVGQRGAEGERGRAMESEGKRESDRQRKSGGRVKRGGDRETERARQTDRAGREPAVSPRRSAHARIPPIRCAGIR